MKYVFSLSVSGFRLVNLIGRMHLLSGLAAKSILPLAVNREYFDTRSESGFGYDFEWHLASQVRQTDRQRDRQISADVCWRIRL